MKLRCPVCGKTPEQGEILATQPLHGEQTYVATEGTEGLLLEPISADVAPSSNVVTLYCTRNGGGCGHAWVTSRPIEDWRHGEH